MKTPTTQSTRRAAPAGAEALPTLPKAATGIDGFDQITGGGLPRGRPTLICGSAGCGKTLFGMEFLVRGAREFGEPGVFVAFEETGPEIVQNVAALGFDVPRLIAEKKLALDHVYVERSEIEETGEYDLEALFLRLGHAIDSVGAKRIVIDTLETLFSSFNDQATLRAELRRLFRWLKDRGVTAIITAERGEGALTRHGLEEYVSDCVVLLDHRVTEQLSTRRLRIVKYRGSTHGTNEYPFLIDERGISVLPLSSIALDHQVSNERVSSGIPRLDTMLGGKGYFAGSSVLVSGTPGTGKSTIAAHFADATCRAGQRCTYFAFEESPAQILRNMRSVGLDLGPWLEGGRLRIEASRPSMFGLEMHLAQMHRLIRDHRPSAVILDPISNFAAAGSEAEVKSMLVRLVDYLKGQGITALFTNLTNPDGSMEGTETGLSSLMDTWLLLRDIELGGERNRGLYVLKSRGMKHSNQIREFVIGADGIRLEDVYVGPEGVLTGSMRQAQEAREKADELIRSQEAARRRRSLERSRHALETQIATLRADLEAQEDELRFMDSEQEGRRRALADDRAQMGRSRRADQEISPSPAQSAIVPNKKPRS